VLLRQRQLLVDGVPVEVGTRAFDLLLVLLEADGALVTKEEMLDRVWPSVIVSEENLKVHVAALRKALGADRELIRTDFGRGYRFTGVLRSKVCHCPIRAKLRSGRALFPQNWGQSFR
jgi:DNA-binding winged helix-turn-helix (wHTH) protein